MTLRSLINFGETQSKVAGINIRMEGDSVFTISMCVLMRDKDNIKLLHSIDGLSNMDMLRQELTSNLPKGSRVHINFEGKGILTKSFNPEEQPKDSQKLLAKFFPMVKTENFIVQTGEGSGVNILSIAREDCLDLVRWIQDAYAVVSVTLGAFVVSQILPILNSRSISLSGYTVASEENRISGIVETPPSISSETVTFGDYSVSKNVLLALASAWYILMGHPGWTISVPPGIEEAQRSFAFNQHLYQATKMALIFLIGVLSINAVIFFSLQTKTAEMEALHVLSEDRNEAQGKLQKQVEELVGEYEKIGWKSNEMPLYFADQLAQQIKEDIQLSVLEIGVLDPELLKKEKKRSYQSMLIKVQGVTGDPVVLQRWVAGIEKLHWVDEIYDEKYQHDNKLGKGIFELYIRLK